MPFDQIMESIQAGLTGDSRKDIRYLQDQIAFHRNHENGLEIARACGRLIYERLPEELKKRFRESMDRDTESWKQVIAEADLNIRNQNYEKALNILEPVVNDLVQFEQFHFQNDSQTEYHDFHELFEELLYRELSHSELDFKPVPIPFTALYSRYGNLLFELGRYGDASDILEKGCAGTLWTSISCWSTPSVTRLPVIWNVSIRSRWVSLTLPLPRLRSAAATEISAITMLKKKTGM